MNLSDYFETVEGLGVLATADAEGQVDVAVYARPHVIDEGTVAFIMAERLSHKNLQSNPHAAYLFVEKGRGYKGKRLHLTRLREETDPAVIDSFRRRQAKMYADKKSKSYLVHFRIERIRPLIGDGAAKDED